MRPFIKAHRDQVYEAAWAEAEKKHGALLETCDEGTKCREQVRAEMKESMIKIWTDLITTFKRNVKTAVKETKTLVTEDWTKLEDCQKNNPCCGYTEIEWINTVTTIVTKNTKISKHVAEWDAFEVRRIEIESRCPDINWNSCPSDAIGSCWNGLPRNVDCSCPDYAPICPTSACENSGVRDT